MMQQLKEVLVQLGQLGELMASGCTPAAGITCYVYSACRTVHYLQHVECNRSWSGRS